jgi:pimeloyl-ACP methyl ester carboxylesterase
MADEIPPAIVLPGVIRPAALAFGPLGEALGNRAELVPKELELYAEESPPGDYALDLEVEGVLRTAAQAGLERFHLVGYSAGGAVSLACAARHPQRLRSLALLEPAWDGNQRRTAAEEALWARFAGLIDSDAPEQEMMAKFSALQLAPGVEPPPPPPGEPPGWMRQRPDGVRALLRAFGEDDVDPERLRAFRGPVYFARGDLSNPDSWPPMEERLARTFPDFTAEVYEGRHHLDPPHLAEPERLAAALLELWERAP